MKIRDRIRDALSVQHPNHGYEPEDIWDVQAATRGLTVVMLDGNVLPLPMTDGSARQFLHTWGIEARL